MWPLKAPWEQIPVHTAFSGVELTLSLSVTLALLVSVAEWELGTLTAAF